jgi:hypothetical protein
VSFGRARFAFLRDVFGNKRIDEPANRQGSSPETFLGLRSLDTTYPTLILKASRGVIHHGALEMATDAGVSSVSTFETDSAG